MLGSTKRLLRENRLSGGAYLALATWWHSLRFFANKLRFGRAFPPDYFDDLFARGADPWLYEDDEVSKRRKSLILGLLRPAPVRAMLEIGCASGWMTRDLALRAEKLVAVDCSPNALRMARERCQDRSNVEFAELDLLKDPIEGRFEVVVCAGVLNFFPRAAQAAIRAKIVGAVEPGGLLLLEHLQDLQPGYEVSGRELHESYARQPGFDTIGNLEEDIYEIVLLKRQGT